MAYSETPNSFAPIVSENARVLILGTMPGADSLRKQEYYGYERNVFWKLIFDIFGGEFTPDYAKKVNFALENKIALWDSLQYCERKGSLDANIKNEKANDFEAFFSEYTSLKTVVFNGHKSYAFFKKYYGLKGGFNYLPLPSTSPANARMNYAEKFENWQKIKKYTL